MKKLMVLALLIAGCGDTVVETLDMDQPVPLDLSSDMAEEYVPPGGPGPGGLKLPPCARPEIDECLGPPAHSDILKRPVEKEMETK
jgi:hypothetical protein